MLSREETFRRKQSLNLSVVNSTFMAPFNSRGLQSYL